MPTNQNRASLIAESATLFPNNNTQEITPLDLRTWLEDGTTSFVTQKDKSTLENALYEARGTSLPSGSTVDLSTASGNFVHITGTATITSFGTLPAGARFVLVFDDACLLTYNATSLIIQGGANKTTAANDACMIISEGGGNWRIVGYFAISGGGGGGITALTGDVTASGTGSVAATIANGAVDIPMLSATGTPSATTFLRGDNTWATPAGASATGYYGAFQDTTTQTAVSANTAYPVKFNTTDLSNSVSVVNDGSGNPTRITLANTGIYNIQFSLQLEKTGGSGNFIVDIWIRKNGVDIPSTTGKVVLTGSASASPIVAAWNYVLDLAATDYVQLMWSTSNNNAVLLASAAAAPHPAVPSAILTVTQQAGIMAGTGITGVVGNSGTTQTGATQTFASGEMTIASAANTHTFTIPDASASTKGLVTTAAQEYAGIKTFGNGTSAGEIRIKEPSGSGTNTVAIKAQAMASDYSLTLPSGAGTAGDFLQYGAGGNLSWANPNTYGFFRSFRIGTLGTGVSITTYTISNYVEIPAGSFSAGDMATILAQFYKTGGVARAYNTQLLINTSASTSGATLLAQINAGGTGIHGFAVREISILSTGGSGQTLIKNTTTPNTDWNTYGIFATNAVSSVTIDWSVTQYLMHALLQSGGPTPAEIGYNAGLSITSR